MAEHNLSKEENNKRYILFKAKLTLVSSKESESWHSQIQGQGKWEHAMHDQIKWLHLWGAMLQIIHFRVWKPKH